MVTQQQIDTEGYNGKEVVEVDPIGGGVDVLYRVGILDAITSNPYSRRLIQWKPSDDVPDVVPGEGRNDNVHFIGIAYGESERFAFVECPEAGSYTLEIPSFSEVSDEVVVRRVFCAALRPTDTDFTFANPIKDITVPASPDTVNLQVIALDEYKTIKATDTTTVTHTQDFPCVFGICYKHKIKGEITESGGGGDDPVEPVEDPTKVTPINPSTGNPYYYNNDTTKPIEIKKTADEFVDWVVVDLTTTSWHTVNFSHLTDLLPCGEVTGVGFIPLQNVGDLTAELGAGETSAAQGSTEEYLNRIFENNEATISQYNEALTRVFPYPFTYFGRKLSVKIKTTGDYRVLVYVRYKLHDLIFRGHIMADATFNSERNTFKPCLGQGYFFQSATFRNTQPNFSVRYCGLYKWRYGTLPFTQDWETDAKLWVGVIDANGGGVVKTGLNQITQYIRSHYADHYAVYIANSDRYPLYDIGCDIELMFAPGDNY